MAIRSSENAAQGLEVTRGKPPRTFLRLLGDEMRLFDV